MTPVLLDTSFLLALVLSDDELHPRAALWQHDLRVPLVITEYVLVEFVDALAAPALRGLASETLRLLRADPLVQVVAADPRWLDAGVTLFESRPDKHWGLTDCISFAIMQRLGMTEALTYDHHFEQAGFRALLRGDPPPNA